MVIGVHAPEFAFEKNVDNVRRAAKDMRVNYPIAIDNDYAIWRAFKNQYWPALYFVDAQGQYSPSSFRRGRIRTVGKDHSTIAGRGRHAAASVMNWFRSMPVVLKLPPIGAA